MENDMQAALKNIIKKEKKDVEKITDELIINGVSTNDLSRKEIEKYMKILNSISHKKWVESLE